MKDNNTAAVVFGIETTGLDPKKDRIVKLEVARNESDKWTKYVVLVNPGDDVPLPENMKEINGIDVDDIRSLGVSTEAAMREFVSLKRGAVLIGFNCNNFDLPFIQQECARCGVDLCMGECENVIDTYLLETLINPHTLDAVWSRVGGVDKDGKTLKIRKIADIYRTFLKRAATENDTIYNDAFEQVAEKGEDIKRCVEGVFVFRDGKTIMNFGKYSGETLESVIQKDTGYLKWMCNSLGLTMPTRQIIVDEAQRILNTKKTSDK